MTHATLLSEAETRQSTHAQAVAVLQAQKAGLEANVASLQDTVNDEGKRAAELQARLDEALIAMQELETQRKRL